MNKTELIEAIRTAQTTLGGKVNAASTLKSKNVEALEALLASLQADIDAELDAAAAFVESELKADSKDAERAQREAEDEAVKNARKAADKAVMERSGDPKPLSRKQCNEALLALGYTGPTSYLMPILRHMVEWAKLGFQEDAAVPAAAHNHVAAADEE